MQLPIDMSKESAMPHHQMLNVGMRRARGLCPTALHDRFCLPILRVQPHDHLKISVRGCPGWKGSSVALWPLEPWADVGIEPLTCQNDQTITVTSQTASILFCALRWYGNFLRTGKPRTWQARLLNRREASRIRQSSERRRSRQDDTCDARS